MGYYEDVYIRHLWVNVEVKGLVTIDGSWGPTFGSLDDPGTEPWFYIRVDTGLFKWHAITKDGVSYRYLYANHDGGDFPSENRPMVHEAIERYVDGLCGSEVESA